MRMLDLKRPFLGACALTEDFQNESSAVDNFGGPRLFQIALLYRRDRAIHDNDARFMAFNQTGNLVDFPAADVSRGTDFVEHDKPALNDVEIDRAREADGFFKARFGRARPVSRNS